MKPKLTFFCELEAQPLAALMTRPVLDRLGSLDAAVSLGFARPSRAGQVVRPERRRHYDDRRLLLPRRGRLVNLATTCPARALVA